MHVWIVTIILFLTLVLLISEKIPFDLTAIGIIVALVLTGTLSPAEAVSGFANPAVITVGAMFLVSRAMLKTGAVGFLGQKVMQYAKGNARLAMFYTLIMVGLASAFINNTPIVVLFIPIILNVTCEYNLSPSKFLIPVSYASILAGNCTLIGTSTNIIISDLSSLHGYGSIGMFELSRLGVPIAVLGIIFIILAAPRFMPGHAAPVCELEDRPDRRYLAEFIIPHGSSLIGTDPVLAFRNSYPTFEIFEIARGHHILFPERDRVKIAENDLLLVKGSPGDLISILRARTVALPHITDGPEFKVGDKESLIVELIIPPQSSLTGEKLMETELTHNPDVHVIGVKRRTLLYTEQKIRHMKLRIGDIILIQCAESKLAPLRNSIDFIIIEDVHHEIINKKKGPLALCIFLGMIAATTSGLASIMVCALTAVFLMILTGCLQLRDAYRALEGNVLVLIAGAIALGTAMEKTGTAKYYANGFLSLFQGADPQVVLAGIILLTSISTQMLSNNATGVLLVPIAISTAVTLGVNPKPFIIAVCLGASACFATPIGYQTNLLVYGPGGYRFSDYLKLGIPLNILVVLIGAVSIPVYWPF